MQVAYAFDALLSQRAVRTPLVAGQEVPGYLLDLLHDRNPEVRQVCEHALVAVAEHDPAWGRRLLEARFRWHNAHWLDVVQHCSTGPQEEQEDSLQEILDRADLLSNGSGASDP